VVGGGLEVEGICRLWAVIFCVTSDQVALVECAGGTLEPAEKTGREFVVEGSGGDGMQHARERTEDGGAGGEGAEVGGAIAAAADAGGVPLAAEALLGAGVGMAEWGTGNSDGAARLALGLAARAESGGRFSGHGHLLETAPGWGWYLNYLFSITCVIFEASS
jgi:hypothetical protein